MSKHTPGPWSRSWVYGAIRHVCRNVDSDAFWSPDEGEDTETANWPDYYTPGDVDLITAAPELLEACQLMETAIATGEVTCDVLNGRFWTAKKLMLAAIAKATGE